MNYLGTYTLFKKEVWRFLKVYNQTLVAPVITNLLFFAVFALSVGSQARQVNGVNFAEFMASGLIIMAVVQQSFSNSSSALVMSKVIGMVIDYLMPPISPFEFVLAITLSSVVRGILVAILGGLSLWCFVPLHIEHIGVMLAFLFMSAFMLSLVGLVTGIITDTFDQMTAIASYIITPLAFLSGTFYSIKNLPEFWQNVAHANPFFYMIDGFRYGMTGVADSDIGLGLVVLGAINIVLFLACYKMVKSGYRLKG